MSYAVKRGKRIAGALSASVAMFAIAQTAFALPTAPGGTFDPGGSVLDGSTVVREPDDYWATHGTHHPSPAGTYVLSPKVSEDGKYTWQVGLENLFGNPNWGAGYKLTHAMKIDAKGVSGTASATVFVNLFGAHKQLTKINYCVFGSDAKKTKLFDVKVLDGTVFTDSALTDPGSWTEFAYEEDIFSANHTYPIGPVSATVKVTVAGKLGLRGAATIKPDMVVLNAKPSMSVYGKASASVGVPGIAAVGVQGTVNFVTLAPEFFHALKDHSGAEEYFAYSTGSLAISSLDGFLDLFVKIGWGWLSTEYRKKILDWDGLDFYKVLYEQSEGHYADDGDDGEWSPSDLEALPTDVVME